MVGFKLVERLNNLSTSTLYALVLIRNIVTQNETLATLLNLFNR